MPEYRDAADRHWEDAGFLINDNRTANADHLFGLAAECAMKAVMLGLGMPLRQDGAPVQSKHRKHVDTLWNEFCTFAQMRNGAKYAATLSAYGNDFIDWDISQRYEHRATITAAMVKKHEEGARTAMNVLKQAFLDGVVQ
jgi:hypothetical protein